MLAAIKDERGWKRVKHSNNHKAMAFRWRHSRANP